MSLNVLVFRSKETLVKVLRLTIQHTINIKFDGLTKDITDIVKDKGYRYILTNKER